MNLSSKSKVYILIALLSLLAIVSLWIIISKKRKNKNAELVNAAISQGVGFLGEDIDSLLFNTKAESGYNTPKDDLEKLKNAKGTIYTGYIDSPDNFKEVLSGKSKSRIKKIIQDFQSAYGIKLNDHINEVFDDLTGYDSKRYDQLLNIVRSAK